MTKNVCHVSTGNLGQHRACWFAQWLRNTEAKDVSQNARKLIKPQLPPSILMWNKNFSMYQERFVWGWNIEEFIWSTVLKWDKTLYFQARCLRTKENQSSGICWFNFFSPLEDKELYKANLHNAWNTSMISTPNFKDKNIIVPFPNLFPRAKYILFQLR